MQPKKLPNPRRKKRLGPNKKTAYEVINGDSAFLSHLRLIYENFYFIECKINSKINIGRNEK